MKKTFIMLFLTAFFMAAVSFFSWSEIDIKALPLKGIKSITVSIEDLSDDAIKIGLAKERLQTVIELRLRKEGIKIVEPLFSPYLYVNIRVVGRAFHVYLSIREGVILERDKTISCLATTWWHGSTGTHTDNPEFIVSSLSELLDFFLNDYYKANPKG
jgi:hypothetical protein